MILPLDIYVLVDTAKIVVSLVVLIVFSIYDIKYRDIPDIYVWLFLGVSIALFTFSIPIYMQYGPSYLVISFILISLLFGAGVPLILYFLGYMGAADVIVIVSLAFLFPYMDVYKYSLLTSDSDYVHIPPVFVIVLYSTLVCVMYLPFRALYTWLVHRDKLPRNIGRILKLVYLFTGTPMKISDYLKSKHYYPLMVFKESDYGVEIIYRSSFNVEDEDYAVHQKHLRHLIDKGRISPDSYIWVTYGIPYIVPLLLGLLLLFIIGDYPLLQLFKIII